MIDALTATVLDALPNVTYTLPYFGEMNLTPYIAVAIFFVSATLVFFLVQKIVLVRLKSLSSKTSTDIDDVVISAIDGIRPWVYTLLALYLAVQPLELPEIVDKMFTAIILIALVWQLIEVATHFVDYGARRVLEKDEDGDGIVDPNAATASHMVTLMARIVLWVFGLIFILSNLGIEVTSLIAGLGIGGIAVAFALQGILSDLFSSFSLYFDKPFRIGDFIIIGDDMGTVERIGIKTTRIRTLQGEELVVSNAELTSTRVQNFKRMNERRIQFQFGITYETPSEKVKQVPEMVGKLIDALDKVRLDRVHFASYGDSALIYEVVYYVESSNYNEYMDIQQQINFAIMDAFNSEGIEFAYPTQTLYVKKES